MERRSGLRSALDADQFSGLRIDYAFHPHIWIVCPNLHRPFGPKRISRFGTESIFQAPRRHIHDHALPASERFVARPARRYEALGRFTRQRPGFALQDDDPVGPRLFRVHQFTVQ